MGVIGLIAVWTASANAQNAPLRIVDPTDAAVVRPGDTLHILVEVSSGVTLLSPVGVIAQHLPGVGTIDAPPYSFQLTVPVTMVPGAYAIMAVAIISPEGLTFSAPVTVRVELDEAQPIDIRVTPRRLELNAGDDPVGLDVAGVFEDGRVITLSRSTFTGFSSTVPAVLAVTPTGTVIPQEPGEGSVLVSYGTLTVEIPVTVLVGVPKRSDQTITFDVLSARTLGDPPFAVAATASSGLAVAFSATGPCSVSGSTVTLTAVGSCTITASQVGNAEYVAAVDVARTFAVRPPSDQDLLVTTVSNPPESALPGSRFSVTDTLVNQGGVGAGRSTIRYYLSANTQKDLSATLLTGTRLVLSLKAGAVSTGAVTVIIPRNTVLNRYYLLACADDLTRVSETDETNNCVASATTVQVTRPDLIETDLGNPPASIVPGGTFSVSETVVNQAAVAAVVSTTRYYLSLNGTTKTRRLRGRRLVSALNAGGTSAGTVIVTVPDDTVHAAYFVLACADDATNVTETNEENNCLASTTTVQVGRPDLIQSGLSSPPAMASRGSTFSIADTAVNQGVAAAGVSTTRYYLSRNGIAKTRRLPVTRTVDPLPPGGSSPGTATTITVPSNMTFGTYYLLACSDDTMTVMESIETNNCQASETTMTVGP